VTPRKSTQAKGKALAERPSGRERSVPPKRPQVKGPDGKMHDAESIGFQVGGEHWNEYVLDDGTLVRLKPVALDFLRVEGLYDQEGNPLYLTKSQNVVVVNAPEKLRKGQQS
jgi:hypothetical protein